MYHLLSGQQDHFTQYNKMCFWATLQTLALSPFTEFNILEDPSS